MSGLVRFLDWLVRRLYVRRKDLQARDDDCVLDEHGTRPAVEAGIKIDF